MSREIITTLSDVVWSIDSRGVATQSRWLVRGLDPTLKSARLANYLVTLRKELLHLAHATGRAHPALVPLNAIDLVDGHTQTRSARVAFGYEPGWGLPPEAEAAPVRATAA